MNTQQWQEELNYIKSINQCDPGKSFNNAPACFGRYCLMQANMAEREGFKDIASDILLHCLGH